MADVAVSRGEPGLLSKWRYVLRTTNPPSRRLDPVSKWLVLTRDALRLKRRRLGARDAHVVWAPLMAGGTYYSAVAHVPCQLIAASIPYGLLCTAVLMGKHVDKIPWDAAEGIRTMRVLLGEARARRVTQGLIAAFYVTVAVDVIVGALPWPALVSFVALPAAAKAWKALSAGRPDAPPADY